MSGREVLDVEAEEVHDAPVGRALVTTPRRDMVAGLIRPVAPPAEVLAAQEETRALIATALKEGRDYGNIPGTDKKKKNLLKAGAERVCAAFAVVPSYRIMEREIDHDRANQYAKRSWEWHPTERGKKVWTEEQGQSQGLYRYVVLCQLVHRESGVVIGEGVGSCSTMESKYIDRPRDLENTALKMAKKRAYVDATLTTFGLSDEFTQDMEDVAIHEDPKAAEPFSLDDAVGFGKYKDKTWRELLASDRQYVQWAVDNMERLTTEAKLALRDAMAAKDAPAPTPNVSQPGNAPSAVRTAFWHEIEAALVLGAISESIYADLVAWLEGNPPDTEMEDQRAILAKRVERRKLEGGKKASAPMQGDLIGTGGR